MEQPDLVKLEELLKTAIQGLRNVSARKMFGCYALWAGKSVFAFVWKHGRIGVKLPREVDYESLMNMEGAEPWKAGPKKMAHWVFVPKAFHSNPVELRKWLDKAYEICLSLSENPSNSKNSSIKSKQK